MGGEFHGCYDLAHDRFLTSTQGASGAFDTAVACEGLSDPRLDKAVPAHVLALARCWSAGASRYAPRENWIERLGFCRTPE